MARHCEVAAGNTLYGRYCSPCHGDPAVAGGVNPDLRYSTALNSVETFKAIVLDGVRKSRGMVSFAAALDTNSVEAVRFYLIHRANEDRALERQVQPAAKK